MQQAAHVEEWDDWGEPPAPSARAIVVPASPIRASASEPSQTRDGPPINTYELLPGLRHSRPPATQAVEFSGAQATVLSELPTESDPFAAAIPFPLDGKVGQFPAFMARSGLFSVGFAPSASSPVAIAPIDIPAQGKYSITLQGSRLTMRDKRLWEVAIDFAKSSKQGVGGMFHIPILEFSKALGWVDRSSKTRECVWNELSLLAAARINFILPDGTEGAGALISTLARKDGTVSLRLNPDFILNAFGRDTQFTMNPTRRAQLKSTLAQWLHDFFCTHSTTPPLTLGYLRKLSGYAGDERRFPSDLDKAMSELRLAAPQMVSEFEVRKDGKNGSDWKLCITKGTEQPTFTMPSHGSSGARRGATRSAKQRGVQL